MQNEDINDFVVVDEQIDNEECNVPCENMCTNTTTTYEITPVNSLSNASSQNTISFQSSCVSIRTNNESASKTDIQANREVMMIEPVSITLPICSEEPLQNTSSQTNEELAPLVEECEKCAFHCVNATTACCIHLLKLCFENKERG